MVPIWIPYALDYAAILKGHAPKLVRCEKCQFEYVYLLSRRAKGEATSFLFLDNKGARERAQSRAADRLSQKLEQSCDPVPCPECGWLQAEMIARARHLRYSWMGMTARVLCPIAALFVFVVILITANLQESRSRDAREFLIAAWSVSALLAAAAIGISVLAWQLPKRLDPNAEDLEIRKQRGKSLALGKEEYLKQLAQFEDEKTGKPKDPNQR
jgi:hypothetical protein